MKSKKRFHARNRVDKILLRGGIEQKFLEKSVELFRQRAEEMVVAGDKVLDGPAAEIRHWEQSRRALRCNVLEKFVGGSFRVMSKMLAMSPLYRWFCRCDDFEEIQVPGKSTLSDYARWLPVEALEGKRNASVCYVA